MAYAKTPSRKKTKNGSDLDAGVGALAGDFDSLPHNDRELLNSLGQDVMPMTKAILQSAPAYDIGDLTKHDGDIHHKPYSYYKFDQDW
jgi:hypothetical protein